ncbi:hypothetical protein ILUMI_12124, partial [Ignelater luminosus]
DPALVWRQLYRLSQNLVMVAKIAALLVVISAVAPVAYSQFGLDAMCESCDDDEDDFLSALFCGFLCEDAEKDEEEETTTISGATTAAGGEAATTPAAAGGSSEAASSAASEGSSAATTAAAK